MSAIDGWTRATENLPSIKQRTIQDTLLLVQQGDIKIVYGSNDFKGYPCLINAIGAMVKAVSDEPVHNEPQLVLAFDAACREIQGERFGFVDSLTAEILVRHFGALQPLPQPELEELPESGITWADVPDTLPADF